MIKRLLILAVLLAVGIPAFTQSVATAWVARYEQAYVDNAYALTIDSLGNVYVTGTTYRGHDANYDYLTIKYYPNSDTAWIRSFSGTPYMGNDFDEAYAIAVDDGGAVYVTGHRYVRYKGWQYGTVKYDSTGNQLWAEDYGGGDQDVARSIAVDPYGKVYVTGRGGYWGNYNWITIKYDSTGNDVWTKSYDGQGGELDEAYAIAVDNIGNVYVTGGSYTGANADYDYTTLKYNPNGDLAWDRLYNGPADTADEAYDLAVDATGNVYVTGWSYGNGTSTDYATIKYNTNGDIAWGRRYNGEANSSDSARAIAVDASGNVYVTGWAYGSGTNADYATIKYDSSGSEVWVRTYNGPANFIDKAFALALDDSGNVYVTGYSWGSGTDGDYATIKYYPNGDTAWVIRYNGPADSEDAACDIAVDLSGCVYVTGYSYGIGTDKDYATIKYVQYICGDIDASGGNANVADLTYLVEYLFFEGPPPPVLEAANVDGEGGVNVADLSYLVDYLFFEGPEPVCGPIE